MMRGLRLAILLPLLLLALAFECVDQKQPGTGTDGLIPGVGGPSNQLITQTVRTGITGDLVKVRLPIWCLDGASATVRIQGAATGFPDGVNLASETISPPAPPSTPPAPLIDVAFSTSVHLERGDMFAIVLSSSGQCAVEDGPEGDSYPPGNMLFKSDNTSGYWLCFCNLAGKGWDMEFETVVSVGTPAALIDQQPGAANGSSPSFPPCDAKVVADCEPAMVAQR